MVETGSQAQFLFMVTAGCLILHWSELKIAFAWVSSLILKKLLLNLSNTKKFAEELK